MPRNIIDSVQGTLDFLILKTLSWGEMHGYAVARWIFDSSGEELQIEEGTPTAILPPRRWRERAGS